MSGLIASIEDVDRFVHAGHAVVTVENEQTGGRFTFQVNVPTDRETGKRDYDSKLQFVSLLSGPDNNSDYTYIGILTRDNPYEVKLTKGSRVTADAPSLKTVNWLLGHAKVGRQLPEFIHVYHEGKCGRCGRRLTVPESIERGIGPECAQHMGM